MKFSRLVNGHVGLILAASVLISSCNKDEFYPTEEMIAGIDKYCSKAPDLNSCEQLSACQPAFTMPEGLDEGEPVFEACISNPDIFNPGEEDGESGEDGSSTGGSTGGDGSQTGTTGGSDDGSTDGSTGGSNNGSTTGGDDGSSEPSAEDLIPPTIPETVEASCMNLADRYLHITHVMQKGKLIGKTSKVKVCHRTGNGSAFALIIACPALKAHVKHHDDTIGACEQ